MRGGHRGVVTKLIREADEILNSTGTLGEVNRGRISVIKQQLAEKLDILNEMDKDILSRCELTAIEAEIEESETVFAKIINCKRRIDELTTTAMVSSAPPLHVSPISTTHPSTTTPSKPRLPKLVLQKFKGDVKD